jgi:hypothetical protein
VALGEAEVLDDATKALADLLRPALNEEDLGWRKVQHFSSGNRDTAEAMADYIMRNWGARLLAEQRREIAQAIAALRPGLRETTAEWVRTDNAIDLALNEVLAVVAQHEADA